MSQTTKQEEGVKSQSAKTARSTPSPDADDIFASSLWFHVLFMVPPYVDARAGSQSWGRQSCIIPIVSMVNTHTTYNLHAPFFDPVCKYLSATKP